MIKSNIRNSLKSAIHLLMKSHPTTMTLYILMRWCSPKLLTKIELGVCPDNLLSWMCHSLIWHLLLVVSLCLKDMVLILWWCGLKVSIQRSSTLSSNDFVPNILSGRCACTWITWVSIVLKQLHRYCKIKGFGSSSIHHTLHLAIQ